MIDNSWKTKLNRAQIEAVKYIDGPVLILAGAGSGKTKTIVSRIVYLISKGINPRSILTLTFTNKAAKEMKQRALDMLREISLESYPLLCTFHGFGNIFLRSYIKKIRSSSSFSIVDTGDKRRILKSIMPDITPTILASKISQYKTSYINSKNSFDRMDGYEKETYKAYMEYEKYLEENNLVDFDDLLVIPYKILNQDSELCNHISSYYKYIMVDEFQDTNEIQNRLLKKLCFLHSNICVVGDDDQSIYSWRGADIRNMLRFTKEYENVKVIKLENNYRSTKQIIGAASSLIKYNNERIGKRLKSIRGSGSNIELISSENEIDEANKIAKNILSSKEDFRNVAVIYRINALNRSIEEVFNKHKIPYKIIGYTNFYEREEIKDAIAYFNIILSNNDFFLKRVINKPKRGIGKDSLDRLLSLSIENGKSVFENISNNHIKSLIRKSSLDSLKKFREDILYLKKVLNNNIENFIDTFESTFGLKKYYLNALKRVDKAANLEEFYDSLKEHFVSDSNFTLKNFLNDIALHSEQNYDEHSSFVSVMSIHSSKGLEFDYVFIIGLEEGFLPVTAYDVNIQEERRLAYVAITRAKKQLFLCYSSSRKHRGKKLLLKKSRFLKELDVEKIDVNESKILNRKIYDEEIYKNGDLVKHELFGMGKIIAIKKSSGVSRLKINFGHSTKEIVSSFVKKV